MVCFHYPILRVNNSLWRKVNCWKNIEHFQKTVVNDGSFSNKLAHVVNDRSFSNKLPHIWVTRYTVTLGLPWDLISYATNCEKGTGPEIQKGHLTNND
jgi:hypothetical protein